MRVLVYVDGSEASRRAVARALELAGDGARVTALHVFPPPLLRDRVSQFDIEPEDLDMRFAREVLTDVEERFRAAGLDVETHAERGPVHEAIAGEVARGGIDLVLVGARPRLPSRITELAELVRQKVSVPVESVS